MHALHDVKNADVSAVRVQELLVERGERHGLKGVASGKAFQR